MKVITNRSLRFWLTLTLIAALLPVVAAAFVPQFISYQGYLTDRLGAPNNETKQIAFAIYNVPAGGSPLWSDVQTVPMFQGLFSLELGNAANPFPVGMFDTPLWLGMTIEDDSEMSPRRPLTSVGFAFKADDALSLQGLTPASLDQSDHVDNVGNPHGVSAGQIGAASEVALSAHAGNTANPHLVTAADVGAASAGDFVTHEAAATAHHARYSDAEAIASMGSEEDGNPLNHQKYRDSQAVSAVLAADGTGSGLDADTLDGVEASFFQDEISSNTVAIQQNESAIAGITSGFSVNANGTRIGGLVHIDDLIFATTARVLSSTGYLFEVSLAGSSSGELMKHFTLYYEASGCIGQAYVRASDYTDFAISQGIVAMSSSRFDELAYSVERNAVAVPLSVLSVTSTNGCINTSGSDVWYPASVNDVLQTGVSGSEFALPITISN